MGNITFDIRSSWRNDVETPDSIAEKFTETLAEFEKIDPTIVNWQVLELSDPSDASEPPDRPLSEVGAEMPAFVRRNIYTHYDDDEPDARGGYHVIAWSTDAPNQNATDGSKYVSVEAGALWRNGIEFTLGLAATQRDASLVTYPLYRQALETMTSIWPVPWAYARALQHSDVPSKSWTPPPAGATLEEMLESMHAVVPPGPVEALWMLYLSAPFAAGLTPSPELTVEHTPGGGMILSATLERPDPNNPDDLRRGRLLQWIVDERLGKGDQWLEWGPRTGPY